MSIEHSQHFLLDAAVRMALNNNIILELATSTEHSSLPHAPLPKHWRLLPVLLTVKHIDCVELGALGLLHLESGPLPQHFILKRLILWNERQFLIRQIWLLSLETGKFPLE